MKVTPSLKPLKLYKDLNKNQSLTKCQLYIIDNCRKKRPDKFPIARLTLKSNRKMGLWETTMSKKEKNIYHPFIT